MPRSNMHACVFNSTYPQDKKTAEGCDRVFKTLKGYENIDKDSF